MRQDSFLGPLLLSEKKKQNKAKKTEPGNEVGLNLKRCFLFLSRISEKKILNFGTAAKRRYFVSFC